jgi:hypothetical protein
MTSRQKRAVRPKRRPPRRRVPHFVGREASPVLDRYPPKENASGFQQPPPLPPPAARADRAPASVPAPPTDTPTAAVPAGPARPLITLDRPFDVDEFASLLGETSIRITVPRDDLPEVLRRVTDFMGFGIYVYSISVRPAPAELLKSFVVELQRVDYSAERGAWVPFIEKGAGESPFGGSAPSS